MIFISQNIKDRRKKQKISAKKLAQLSGVSFNTIVNIESGKNTNPTIDSLSKIAKALAIKVDDLLEPVAFQPDLERLKNTKWYRQGAEIIPAFIEPAWQGILAAKIQDLIMYYGQGMCYAYYNSRVMEEKAQEWLKRLNKSQGPVEAQKVWHNLETEHNRLIAKLANIKDWDASSKEEILSWYKKLYDIIRAYWGWTNRLDYFDYCGKKLLHEYVRERQISIHQGELDRLVAPKKISYLQQLTLGVYGIAQNIKDEQLADKFLAIKTSQDWDRFGGRHMAMNKKVERLHKKYYWYRNTWGTVEGLDIIHFVNEIQRIIKKPFEKEYIEDIKQYEYFIDRSCREIYKKYDLPLADINFFTFMALLADWRDERKMFTLKSNHYLYKILKSLAKKNQISFSLIKHATGQEIINDCYNVEELSERNRGTFVIYNKKGEYGYVYGEVVQKILDVVNGQLAGQDLRGSIACKGKAQGFVRLILGKEDFKKMKPGDILVAVMTRPEYVPLMKMAGAVITDEGGIASHAAIVSRELGIPCIVGTQQATSILRDGMEVEVNANHGLIKVL